LGGRDNSIKKNAAIILVASKEDGIEVNADKKVTQNYIFCIDVKLGRSH